MNIAKEKNGPPSQPQTSERSFNFYLGIYIFYITFFVANIFLIWVAPVKYEKYFFGEDRIIEWLTFICFLGASFVSVVIIKRFFPLMNRLSLIYFAGIAVFFFVCAGEEISWGQRILGFHTPEFMIEHNQQQEFNIHNLRVSFLHPRDIMGIYVYLYGIVLPLYFYLSKGLPGNTWQRYIYHPLIAICFIWSEMLNLSRGPFSTFIKDRVSMDTFHLITNQIEESVEMYWAFSTLFGMMVIKEAWNLFADRKDSPK